jgi:hypothetical protein
MLQSIYGNRPLKIRSILLENSPNTLLARSMRQLRPRTLLLWIIAPSLLGLGVCKLGDVLRNSNPTFSQTLPGRWLVAIFATGCCVGLSILVLRAPGKADVQSRIGSGEIDPARTSLVQRVIFSDSYGSLPKWLYLPFLAVGVVMTALAALGILGIVLWTIFS